MDIIDVLLKTIGGNGLNALAPVFKLLNENSFDIKKVLEKVTPEDLAKIFQGIAETTENGKTAQNAQKNAPFVTETNGVAPISDIADKEIVYALNKYVNSELIR